MPACKDPDRESQRRAKIAEAMRNRVVGEDTRVKTSARMKGNTYTRGKKRSEESCKKMSESKKGEKHPLFGKHPTEETRRKMSEALRGEKNPNFGKQMSEEQKQKISKKLTGTHLSEEVKQKLRIALTGKVRSPEHCRKLSEAQKGRISPMRGKKFTEEHKRKISIANLGKGAGIRRPPRSEEWRKKLSIANIGKSSPSKGKSLPEWQRKLLSETHKGEKNPMWNGGSSFAPYCEKFNERFRERVRAFFGYKCVETGEVESDGRKLVVHHVTYNKKVCCDGNRPLFVAILRRVHNRTGHNREWWEQHFTEIIDIQYGGKCYFTEEEMQEYERKNR